MLAVGHERPTLTPSGVGVRGGVDVGVGAGL